MTSPVEDVLVRCFNRECRVETFRDWHRASINAALDPTMAADDEYVAAAGTATCPACGTILDFGTLVVRRLVDTETGDIDEMWERP